MNRASKAGRAILRRQLLRSASYEGSAGRAWFAGFELRAPSIAAFFCGDDVEGGPNGRVWRHRVPSRIEHVVEDGGLPILRIHEMDGGLADLVQRAVAVPALVDIHVELPADPEDVRPQLLTSTTREDFRRIRRANFSYRVTRDPEAIREFHDRHHAPLVTRQFPMDGKAASLGEMMDRLQRGGELICADIDGVWVAGLFNIPNESVYALRSLGIRDADVTIRNKRVVAALIIRSLERAAELGSDTATLGRSLPFLGKGPVWFKAKWGGILTREPATHHMHMFMDLRNPAVRRMLSDTPVIHTIDDALVVSAWLEPGDKPLQVTTREAGRFPGISRWFVLGEPETLAAGAEQLSANERIVPVAITPSGERPLWLGEELARTAVSA